MEKKVFHSLVCFTRLSVSLACLFHSLIMHITDLEGTIMVLQGRLELQKLYNMIPKTERGLR